MSGYILSILGIVLLGVIIEVVIPSGNISKYIKSIFSIFVVAVIISPVVNFISNKNNFKLTYTDYSLDSELIEYIYSNRVKNTETQIENYLKEEGFDKIDIKIVFSIENNEITYNLCNVNLKNMVISADKQHINKYEFIKDVVINFTNLTEEEINFYEQWKRKKRI